MLSSFISPHVKEKEMRVFFSHSPSKWGIGGVGGLEVHSTWQHILSHLFFSHLFQG